MRDKCQTAVLLSTPSNRGPDIQRSHLSDETLHTGAHDNGKNRAIPRSHFKVVESSNQTRTTVKRKSGGQVTNPQPMSQVLEMVKMAEMNLPGSA